MPESTEKHAASLRSFYRKFPDDTAVRTYFEGLRWNGKPQCAHCGASDIAIVKNEKPMPYRCRRCRKHFSVRTGTLLADSRLPLQSWLLAIYLMTTSRKGISSCQLARELGCTQKTAWLLEHRIREAYKSGELTGSPSPAAADDTCFGGKGRNLHLKLYVEEIARRYSPSRNTSEAVTGIADGFTRPRLTCKDGTRG